MRWARLRKRSRDRKRSSTSSCLLIRSSESRIDTCSVCNTRLVTMQEYIFRDHSRLSIVHNRKSDNNARYRSRNSRWPVIGRRLICILYNQELQRQVASFLHLQIHLQKRYDGKTEDSTLRQNWLVSAIDGLRRALSLHGRLDDNESNPNTIIALTPIWRISPLSQSSFHRSPRIVQTSSKNALLALSTVLWPHT
jgi:hypothetical protein